MVLTQKQTYLSREQNGEQRNKPIHLESIHQQKRQQYAVVKRQSFQQVVLRKLDSHMQISAVRTPRHTIHKNKLKMD